MKNKVTECSQMEETTEVEIGSLWRREDGDGIVDYYIATSIGEGINLRTGRTLGYSGRKIDSFLQYPLLYTQVFCVTIEKED